MTPEKIEELAREHEAFGFGKAGSDGVSIHGFEPDGLLAFAEAVRAQALEEAAQVCGRLADLMEQGAGADSPWHRLRQAERSIHALKAAK